MPNSFDEKFEPLAAHIGRAQPDDAGVDQIALSIAVSFKRLADAAEADLKHQASIRESAVHIAGSLKAIEEGLCGDDTGFNLGQNFAGGIEEMAFSIGQQIKRGMEAG